METEIVASVKFKPLKMSKVIDNSSKSVTISILFTADRETVLRIIAKPFVGLNFNIPAKLVIDAVFTAVKLIKSIINSYFLTFQDLLFLPLLSNSSNYAYLLSLHVTEAVTPQPPLN